MNTIDNKVPLHGNVNITDNANYNYANGLTNYSTSTVEISMYHPKTLVDAVVDEETITLTYVQRAKYEFTTYNHTLTLGAQFKYRNSDLVFKEIYGVRDGKLTLLKTINGRIVPPTLTESYEFDEE
jgi:hypothetical protein